MWGRGIVTEATWACLRYAFEEVGMERVIGGAKAPNTTSLRVIEKLGMKCLGNINPSARANLTMHFAARSFLPRR